MHLLRRRIDSPTRRRERSPLRCYQTASRETTEPATRGVAMVRLAALRKTLVYAISTAYY